MRKIPKQEYTVKFKEQAVKRVKDGKTVSAAAKEMGLVEQTLRNWVKVFETRQLDGPGVRQVTPEEMERSRRRAEAIRLKREVDILKKAMALNRAFNPSAPNQVWSADITRSLDRRRLALL